MKTGIVNYILTTIILLVSIFGYAQKKPGFIPPSIDDEEIPVVKTELPVPEEGQDYVVKYFKGITDGVESRIAVKKLGYIIRPAMVHVISEDGRELAIELVKKNWDDVVRSGKTSDGNFQESFKTAMEFGIKISAKEMGIPFIVAVSAGVELFPASNLFVDASTMRSGDGSKEITTTNEVELTDQKSGQSNSILFIIIAIALVGILALLAVLVFKRKGKGAATILLFMMALPLNAGLVPTGVELLGSLGENLVKGLGQHYGKGGFSGNSPLSEDDRDFEPEPDPRGQPSLPSSCYGVARISNSGSSGGSLNSNRNQNNDRDWNENENLSNMESQNSSTNNVEFQPYQTAEGNPTDKPDNGPGDRSQSEDDKLLRLPRYDQNGNLLNAGDFPNAPTHISPSGNESTKNPYIDNGSYSDQPSPTYDQNGHLKYPEEFPDAPGKIDINTGLPIMRPVLQGQEQQGPQSIKQPVYDQNGTLIDAGDYPDAPSKLDPRKIDSEVAPQNPFTGSSSEGNSGSMEPKEQNQNSSISRNDPSRNNSTLSTGGNNGSGNNAGSNSSNGYNSGEFGRPSSPTSPPGTNGQNGSGDRKNEAGCQCLERAYADLQKRRHSLEKLLKIGQHTKKVTDFGISFGDDFSGVHGVSGLVWQTQRAKVLKSIDQFDITYNNKYNELIDKLYNVLIEIDECEKKLGYENWYSHAGFIYYEFMKVRYASYK